jgi:ribonuclease HII
MAEGEPQEPDPDAQDPAVAFAGRFLFERRLWAAGHRRIAGVDEVGRGPLAGPVVAAAVVLRPDAFMPGLDDSKRLTPRQREGLAAAVRAQAQAWCIAEVDVEEIDRINIARAAFLAMRRALAGLGVAVDHVLVDGFRIPGYGGGQTAIVGGDHLSNSIAAASVLAKVHRDERMRAWDRVWPGYGFARHKGYATPEHLAALERLGPCPLHRRSFHWGKAPVQLRLVGDEPAASGDSP